MIHACTVYYYPDLDMFIPTLTSTPRGAYITCSHIRVIMHYITGLTSRSLDQKRPCSQAYRKNLIRNTCEMHHRFDQSPTSDDFVQVAAINHKKGIYYCGLPKSGSRSWLTYMVNVSDTHPAKSWKIRDTGFMHEAGQFNYIYSHTQSTKVFSNLCAGSSNYGSLNSNAEILTYLM